MSQAPAYDDDEEEGLDDLMTSRETQPKEVRTTTVHLIYTFEYITVVFLSNQCIVHLSV